VLGSRLMAAKVRVGSYKGGHGENSPTKSNTFEVSTNFFPLQLQKKMNRTLEPYVVASVESTTIRSTGVYTPAPSRPRRVDSAESTCTCACQSQNQSGALPADPDHPSSGAVPHALESYSGKLVTTRANIGVGMKFHLEKGGHFVNLFADVKYGVPLGTNV